jgi:streptogramin lyase
MNMFRQIVVLCLFSGTAILSWVPLAFGQMQYPLAVAATNEGEIYVADRQLPGIWKITAGKAEIYFQGSKMFRTPLNAVRCLAIDSKGRLLAGDSATREVYRFDEAAKPTPLTEGKIGIPMSIAVAKDGELFVADLEVQRIWKVPAAGGEPQEFAVIAGVRGLAFDSQEQLIAVTNLADPVIRFSADGKKEVLVKGRPFQFPHHVAVAEEDVLYIADNYASAIWKVVPGSEPVKFAEGKPLDKPVGVAWHDKTLLVADPHAKQIFQIAADGKITPLVEPTK